MADDKQGSREDRAMRVDTAIVRELAELLDSNGLTEIEVEDGDRKIRVRREAAPTMQAAPAMPAVAAPALAPLAPAAETPATAPPGEAVRSPMVGTAFLSAEPGGARFIAEGQAVKEGDTLMIIEAMKVMNPILAPKAGTVRQLLVADAQPVEFDQPLVIVE